LSTEDQTLGHFLPVPSELKALVEVLDLVDTVSERHWRGAAESAVAVWPWRWLVTGRFSAGVEMSSMSSKLSLGDAGEVMHSAVMSSRLTTPVMSSKLSLSDAGEVMHSSLTTAVMSSSLTKLSLWAVTKLSLTTAVTVTSLTNTVT
jgi:hypothetical protein